MNPHEALQYISQALSDYGRTLPPSAAMPFQQVAQEAVNALLPLVQAPQPATDTPPPERPPLHAVPQE